MKKKKTTATATAMTKKTTEYGNGYFAKITQIMERDGSPKIDPGALGRIGRTFDINRSAVEIGHDGFLYCIYPGFSKSLHTTRILDILRTESRLIIWTLNSIYVLERICL